MSLVATRLSLIHTCTVERDANAGSDDGWNNPLPPDWQTHLEGLRCRGWTAGHETVTNKDTLAVVLEIHLLVPLDTDVAENDRIPAILSRGAVFQAGPLAVRAVLSRRDHLELILAKAV